MKIVNVDLEKGNHPPSFIALGNFDGLHKGHIALINKVVSAAKEKNMKSSVLIFSQHTKNVIFGGKQILLTSKNQKYELLEKSGIDIIYEMDFNLAVMEMKPLDFFHKLLCKNLNIKGIVVGYDYKFGYRAGGDTTLLKSLTDENNIWFSIVPPVLSNGESVSSTKIRNFIRDGYIQKANNYLGHPFTIRGEVIHGKKLGTKMGFPTANIKMEDNYVVPKFGVYDTDIIIDGKRYRAATSVGTNPTLEEVGIKIEAHILDFDKMIYGKTVDLEFLRFIREELTFSSIETLFEQIKKDREIVEKR
ncbi:MAG: bifunctional riboflavin kinase/FAD synthetase [Tissierellia bacterium]|nr:bifunctional riboflavin kinase/FAD synthetase [Tissierellia bacterium]